MSLSMRPPVLFDTNVIIEAVRTQCWNAITGQVSIETVGACRVEALAGSAATIRNYVPVVPRADSLDEGEHDLLAHAYARSEPFLLCSPDKAAIRAAVALGIGDRLVSLDELVAEVGARPRPALREQFTSSWLVSFRSRVKVEGL